jgi:hypothetical protein
MSSGFIETCFSIYCITYLAFIIQRRESFKDFQWKMGSQKMENPCINCVQQFYKYGKWT